jgi:hypothetical protein
MREMVREGVIDKVALLETSSALSVSTAHQTGPREVLLGQRLKFRRSGISYSTGRRCLQPLADDST